MGDAVALGDGEAPEAPLRRRGVDFIEELAGAQVEGAEARARREKLVDVHRAGGVDLDDLEGGVRVGAEGVIERDVADVEEGEAREAGAGRREAEHGARAHEVVGDVEVEVLGVAGSGVFEAAADVLVAEVAVGEAAAAVLAEVEGEGEAVEVAVPAAVERAEEPVRVVDPGAEVEVERGRRGPAARPEPAPPRGERARADGGLEREQGQNAQLQVLRQRQDGVPLIGRHRRCFLSDPPLLRGRRAELRRHRGATRRRIPPAPPLTGPPRLPLLAHETAMLLQRAGLTERFFWRIVLGPAHRRVRGILYYYYYFANFF